MDTLATYRVTHPTKKPHIPNPSLAPYLRAKRMANVTIRQMPITMKRIDNLVSFVNIPDGHSMYTTANNKATLGKFNIAFHPDDRFVCTYPELIRIEIAMMYPTHNSVAGIWIIVPSRPCDMTKYNAKQYTKICKELITRPTIPMILDIPTPYCKHMSIKVNMMITNV